MLLIAVTWRTLPVCLFFFSKYFIPKGVRMLIIGVTICFDKKHFDSLMEMADASKASRLIRH